MRHNAQVVSFPIDAATGPMLRDFTGSDRERLDEMAARLASISSLLYCLKNSEPFEGQPANALAAVEQMVDDCLAVAELRPIAACQ